MLNEEEDGKEPRGITRKSISHGSLIACPEIFKARGGILFSKRWMISMENTLGRKNEVKKDL